MTVKKANRKDRIKYFAKIDDIAAELTGGRLVEPVKRTAREHKKIDELTATALRKSI